MLTMAERTDLCGTSFHYPDEASGKTAVLEALSLVLDQFLAWLDEAFRAPVQSAPAPAPRAAGAYDP